MPSEPPVVRFSAKITVASESTTFASVLGSDEFHAWVDKQYRKLGDK